MVGVEEEAIWQTVLIRDVLLYMVEEGVLVQEANRVVGIVIHIL